MKEKHSTLAVWKSPCENRADWDSGNMCCSNSGRTDFEYPRRLVVLTDFILGFPQAILENVGINHFHILSIHHSVILSHLIRHCITSAVDLAS